jgi:hypothetical protein
MLRLHRIFKNYAETGSFNEQVNLYGFVDSRIFLTKTGDLGIVFEVRGVDYECLDGNTLDGMTKRLESALKLFDDSYRIYQYLFKRNNETIPYKLYGKPVVDTAIENRLAYFAGKADSLFSLSIYYVILFEGFRYTRTLGSTLLEFPKHPTKALSELQAHFLGRKQVSTPRPRPNLTAPRLPFPFDCASRLRHSPHPPVFATNDKRHGSGEPSGLTGFPLRAGRKRGCLLRDQMQTPPKEGHQWSQIHSS